MDISVDIKEPTAKQCDTHEKVWEADGKVGFAIWYPQMGGYGGAAVAIFDVEWEETSDGGRTGGCVDVLVWHDGEFPFGEKNASPRVIHHCDPDQFIDFGMKLAELNAKGRKICNVKNN